MPTSSNNPLDGGDLENTLRRHRVRKNWLKEAEEWLRSDRDVIQVRSNYELAWGDYPSFLFDMPRAVWEPQLQKQVEEIRQQVVEMDRIAREYVEAALK